MAPDRPYISETQTRNNLRYTDCCDRKSGGNRVYKENTALEMALQVNGNVGTDGLSEQDLTFTFWSSNSATGQSRQVNGDVLDANLASRFFS